MLANFSKGNTSGDDNTPKCAQQKGITLLNKSVYQPLILTQPTGMDY